MEDVLSALISASNLLTRQNVLLQAALKPEVSAAAHSDFDIAGAKSIAKATESVHSTTDIDCKNSLDQDDVDFITSVVDAAAAKPLSRSDARFLRIVRRLALTAANPVIIQSDSNAEPKSPSAGAGRPASRDPFNSQSAGTAVRSGTVSASAAVVDTIAARASAANGSGGGSPAREELQALQKSAATAETAKIAKLLREQRTTEVVLSLAAELATVQPSGDELVRLIVAQCRLLLNSDRVTLFLVEGDELVSRVIGSDEVGEVSEIRVPKGRGIVGYVAETRERLNLRDAYSDFRFNADVDLRTGYRTRSLLTMPVLAEGEVVAVAQCINKLNYTVGGGSVQSNVSGSGSGGGISPGGHGTSNVIDFTEEDESLFELFSFFAGMALRNQKLFRRAKSHHARLELMVRAAEALASSVTDHSALTEAVMKAAQHLVRADQCSLFIREGDSLVARTEKGEINVAVGQGIVGTCALTKTPLNIKDAYSDPRFNREVDRVTGYRTHSLLAMPIMNGDRLVAVAQLLNRRRENIFMAENSVDDYALPVEVASQLLPQVGSVSEFVTRSPGGAVESPVGGLASLSGSLVSPGGIPRNGSVSGPARRGQSRGDPSKLDGPQTARITHSADAVGGRDSDASGQFCPFSDDDIVAFAAFSAFIGAVLRAAQQHSQLEQDAKERAALAAAMNDVVTVDLRNISDVVEGVMMGAMKVVRAERCAFFLRDKATNELYSRIASDSGKEIRFPMTQGIAGATVMGAAPIIVPDAYADSRFNPEVDRTSGYITRNILCVPVKYEGEVVGVAQLLNKLDDKGRPDVFTDHDCQSLGLFAGVAGVVVRNSALYEFLVESGQQANAVFEGVLSNTAVNTRRRRSSVREAQIWLPPSTKVLAARDILEAMPAHECDALRSWGFDPFNYHWNAADNADRLPPLLVWMFDDLGLLQPFNLHDNNRLLTFSLAAQRKYRKIPYHSFTHAFDVTHAIYQMLTRGGLRQYFTPEWMLVLMVAAVVHDIDHTGLNNSFHHRAETPLGILSYASGAQSVLEMHHCNLAIELLGYEQADILQALGEGGRADAWKRMITLILNTDMSRHRDNVEELTQFLDDLGGEGSGRNANPAPLAASSADGGVALAIPTTGEVNDAPEGGDGGASSWKFGLNPAKADEMDDADRLRIAVAMMKSADISNVTKPFAVSRKWAEAVTEEFYQQGDIERGRGMDVAQMNDRLAATSLADGQLGFINFVAKQWFGLFCRLSPDLEFMNQTMLENVSLWEQVRATHQAQLAKEREEAAAASGDGAEAMGG